MESQALKAPDTIVGIDPYQTGGSPPPLLFLFLFLLCKGCGLIICEPLTPALSGEIGEDQMSRWGYNW